MYRVELKEISIPILNGLWILFLMYRVELKGTVGFSSSTSVIKFLMYRVELKDFVRTDVVSQDPVLSCS